MYNKIDWYDDILVDRHFQSDKLKKPSRLLVVVLPITAIKFIFQPILLRPAISQAVLKVCLSALFAEDDLTAEFSG